MQKHNSPIILVAATIIEAQPVIDSFSLVKETRTPFALYCSEDLCLVISGIGKINAAVATSWALTSMQCSVVINGGASGALDKSCSLGSIYSISSVIDYDRPHLKSGKPYRYHPDIVPSLEDATLATCNIPAIDPLQRQNLSEYAKLIDMEGAAVVHTCSKFSVPCCLLKYVSDTPQHVHDKDIVKNIKEYGWILASTVESLIADDHLPGRV